MIIVTYTLATMQGVTEQLSNSVRIMLKGS